MPTTSWNPVFLRILPLLALLLVLPRNPSAAEPEATTGGLWIMRHGEDAGRDRQLTDAGRAQVRDAAAVLDGIRNLRILTSPRERCRQTAAVVRERVPGPEIEVAEWLDTSAPPPRDWRELVPEGPVLLVTHQPVIQAIQRMLGRPLTGIPPAFLQQLEAPAPAAATSPRPSADRNEPPSK